MTRAWIFVGASLVAILMPAPARAHRLDEYLQATRLSIDVDRVDVEIDLTPGVSVAREVFDVIDVNHDGRVSVAERDAYAAAVSRSIALSIDDRPIPIVDATLRVPEFADMSEGVGTIRLRASATLAAVGSGRHRLTYVNRHRPEGSVYLVNALVPSDPRIHIATQERDAAQHQLTLDYDVARGLPSPRAWSLLASLTLGGVLVATRRAKV